MYVLILLVQIVSTVVGSDGVKTTKSGKLNFVDLSGSENLKRRCVVGFL